MTLIKEGKVLFNDALNTFYLWSGQKRAIQAARQEIWLAARHLLHAPSHRQDSTSHSLCYTSRGALTGMRNSEWIFHEGLITQPHTPWARCPTMELPLTPTLIKYRSTQVCWFTCNRRLRLYGAGEFDRTPFVHIQGLGECGEHWAAGLLIRVWNQTLPIS